VEFEVEFEVLLRSNGNSLFIKLNISNGLPLSHVLSINSGVMEEKEEEEEEEEEEEDDDDGEAVDVSGIMQFKHA